MVAAGSTSLAKAAAPERSGAAAVLVIETVAGFAGPAWSRVHRRGSVATNVLRGRQPHTLLTKAYIDNTSQDDVTFQSPSFPPFDSLRTGRPAAERESSDFRLDVQSESHWVPAFAHCCPG
jgi:hypothetical protein